MSVDQESTHEYESQVLTKAAKKLYMDEKMADVHFIFKSGERVPAHKYLLAAASDVFEAMFYGSIKEKGDVKIDDASSVGFKEFLKFFYFNKIKLTMANINDVMNLGQKYNVTECFDLCVRFWMEILTPDNMYQIFKIADFYDRNDLKETCGDLISSDTENVLQSPSFLEYDSQILNHILKIDKLSCPETEVFKAVMSWVKAASKQEEITKDIIQTHLGDLFHEIRFRSMKYEEFVDLLSLYGKLFTLDELHEILQMIRNEEFQPKIFNPLCRTLITLPWDEWAILECDREFDSFSPDTYSIQNVEITTFTTNKSLLLGYLKCAANENFATRLEKPLPVDVTIIRLPTKTGSKNERIKVVLRTIKVVLTEYEKLIKLPKPIVIDPRFKYEIRMNIGDSVDYKTHVVMRSEVQLERNILVTFYNDPLINGERRGLVYKLGFNWLFTSK